MSTPRTIIQTLGNFFRMIGRAIKRLVIRAIQFVRHIVGWFKSLALNPREDTPFIIDAERMHEMLGEAPVVDCGIFEAVYNDETQTITHHRLIETDELDDRTEELLETSQNGIVVLT